MLPVLTSKSEKNTQRNIARDTTDPDDRVRDWSCLIETKFGHQMTPFCIHGSDKKVIAINTTILIIITSIFQEPGHGNVLVPVSWI